MKVLILHPRLDLSFKKGLVTNNPSENLPPIRQYWKNFLENLQVYHLERGDNVSVIHLPLWQFNTVQVQERHADIVYVPHKDIYRFNPFPVKPMFYMQMVFPWVFEVDSRGPFSLSSKYPLEIGEGVDNSLIEALKIRALQGESKFPQPRKKIKEKGFVFFAGQMERDESIKIHSKINVKTALEDTIRFCKENNLPLLIKPHPFETERYTQELVAKYKYGELVNANITSLLENCSTLITVNSGVGMEALLFNKPVIHYGYAEYSPVGTKVEQLTSSAFSSDKTSLYPQFITTYFKNRIDSTKLESYSLLEQYL